MRDLLFHFGITLGKRYTDKQKSLFLSEMEEFLKENNKPFEIMEYKKSFYKSKHLVVGDLTKAKTIICAYYDTPKVSLLNSPYYPLITKENLKVERINLIFNTFIFLVINCLLVIVFMAIMNLSLVLRVIILLIEFVVFILNIKLFEGIPNTVNHNRNSASIVLMIHLIKQNYKNCAYVFIDNASTSLVGYEQLREQLNKNNSNKIILDSLAYGESVFIANQIDMEEYKNVNPFSAQGNYWFNQFTNACVLTSGKLMNQKIRVENTRRFNDFKVDLERLNSLESLLIRMIEREVK